MSNPPDNRKRQRVRGRLTLISVVAVAATVSALASRPLPLPTEHISTMASAVDSARCAECHGEIVTQFQDSPHARTLSRAAAPEIAKRFSGSVQLANERERFQFEVVDDQLSVANSRFPERLRIDWVFGSGRHAQTPVSLLENHLGRTELLEHRVSWYPHAGLAATLGLFDGHGDGLDALGRSLPNSATIRCFACHSTYVPVDAGRINLAGLQPCVDCARCHFGAAEHLAVVGAGEEFAGADPLDVLIGDWSQLEPLDSVNRCGECHRRADEFTADELQAGNQRLVRFASVGLVMSQCFQQQSSVPASNPAGSLTCLTCHNPHRPAESDPDFYRHRCLNCHGTSASHIRPCSSQPLASHCTTCHLPKVRVHEHLSFSDHWIRVPAQSPTIDD